jgi:hypothetical protein
LLLARLIVRIGRKKSEQKDLRKLEICLEKKLHVKLGPKKE